MSADPKGSTGTGHGDYSACADLKARLAAIDALAGEPRRRLAPQALAGLVSCLGAERKLVVRRAIDALAALAAHDPRIIEALRQAMHGADARMRWGAAYALGSIGGALDLRTAGALLAALASNDGDVRWASADLIVRLGRVYPREIRRGLLGLEGAAGRHARKMALYCMRELGLDDPAVRAHALRAAASQDSQVRLAALSQLASFAGHGAQCAAVALRALVADDAPGVRRAAAVALGRLGHKSSQVLAALGRAGDDPADASLRKAARQALARLELAR